MEQWLDNHEDEWLTNVSLEVCRMWLLLTVCIRFLIFPPVRLAR